MSETTDTPEGTSAPDPEPQPSVPDTPAPDTEEPEQKPQREADEERQARGGEKRFAIITAKLSAAERLYQAQQAELEYYRRQVADRAPADETPEQRYQRERTQIRAEVEAEIRKERFHQEGFAQYRDWEQKTKDLMAMGADPGIASLLVEMPDGVKVTAALADDPTELQRIANIQSERGRAIALGKFAATLDADAGGTHAARPALQLTKAPPPIRPVTGRAAPQFNEYTATAEQLADRYMKQNLERQKRR
jgi:hypothetical protein